MSQERAQTANAAGAARAGRGSSSASTGQLPLQSVNPLLLSPPSLSPPPFLPPPSYPVFLQESDCVFQQRADLPPRQAPERLPMIRSSIYTGPRCTACVYSIYTPARCAPFPIMFPDSSVRTRRLHSLTQNRIPQPYRITDTLLRLQRSTLAPNHCITTSAQIRGFGPSLKYKC